MRVFLAASISRFQGTEELFSEIEKLPYSKPVKTPELHLTFRFFGEMSPITLKELEERAASLAFRKFLIKVHGVGAFPRIERANVLFLQVENSPTIMENATLAANIEPAERDNRPFVPHITVSRFKKPADCSLIQKKFDTLSFESGIDKITIYESILNENGPVYKQVMSLQLK